METVFNWFFRKTQNFDSVFFIVIIGSFCGVIASATVQYRYHDYAVVILVSVCVLILFFQRGAYSTLKREKQKLRVILEYATEGVTIIDMNGKLLLVNRTVADQLGEKTENLVGKSLWDVFPKTFADQRIERIRDSIAEGKGYSDEISVPLIDGTRWLESHSKPVRDIEGFEDTIINVGVDITERRQAEVALKESENKYRTLFNNMNIAFALHEVIFNENLKPIDYVFLEVNREFENITGLAATNIIGKKVTEALPGTENDPANWIEMYGNVVSTGASVQL